MYNSQTPIDIHCSKLVDWLVQRRHCKKDWGENLASIRRKIRSALEDMPENEEIKQLLIGSKLDYFKSKRIVEILKTVEASSKNIFGFYTSKRMKDWQDIVYSYEKDYIYLVELATDLIRETNYEVPTVRKLINNLRREKEEAEKERANVLRRAQQFKSEHQKLAQTYGTDQLKTLSNTMEEITLLSKGLEEYLEYYQTYSSSVTRQDASSFAGMLMYIITKGNTTIYEYKYGEAPMKVEVSEVATSTAPNSNSSEIEIVDDEIDFGDDIPSSDSSNGFVHVDKSSDNGNGNGNIEETFIKVDEEADSQKLICGDDNKTARGEEARLVLAVRKTRIQFLNNLHEIEAFYNQLSVNLEQTRLDDRSTTFLTIEASRAPKYNVEQLAQILGKIRQIITTIDNEKNRILFQMSDSPSFMESVKEKLEKKCKQASDCIKKADLLTEKINTLENQREETESHLKRCVMSAKKLQDAAENSLMDLYGGRTINIMSCVN